MIKGMTLPEIRRKNLQNGSTQEIFQKRKKATYHN